MKHAQGLVLFSTVMFISLIALMVLSVMRTVLLFAQVNQLLEKSHYSFYALEQVVRVIQQQLVRDPHATPLRKLRYDNVDYYVEVDDAGEWLCMRIKRPTHSVASHHWVVTVYTATQSHKHLQVRIATPSSSQHCREETRTWIHPGVLSWRYVVLTDEHNVLV